MLRIVIATIALCLLAGTTIAGRIELDKSFFGGWEYSIDGIEYKKVGYSGSGLRFEMSDNEAAQKQIDKYATCKTWATITAVPGGFLIGWPLGGYLANLEWKHSYTNMYIIGVPLCLTSIVFEATATGKLKKAVRIYNGEESAPKVFIPSPEIFASTEGSPRFGLTWRF